MKGWSKVLAAVVILIALTVNSASADGASYCGSGAYAFYPTHDATHKITYYGSAGSRAEIWWYGDTVLRNYIYNGTPYYMYTPVSNPITIRMSDGCVYIEDN